MNTTYTLPLADLSQPMLATHQLKQRGLGFKNLPELSDFTKVCQGLLTDLKVLTKRQVLDAQSSLLFFNLSYSEFTLMLHGIQQHYGVNLPIKEVSLANSVEDLYRHIAIRMANRF